MNSSEELELIHERARQCPGIAVLINPSIQVAIAAVSGVAQSATIHGPTRVYVVHPSRQHLALVYGELNKINLAHEATLYHGSLTQFHRDLPLRIDLICSDFADLAPEAGGIRFMINAGTEILCLNGAAGSVDQTAAKQLVDSGILQLDTAGPGGAVYRATERCHGAEFVSRADSRIAIRSRLHERYFLSAAYGEATHTLVADLTEDIRREFSREFPTASGSGSWPYVAPESGGLPLTLPSGKPWPKISIVTATRNQGKYIEETILSVLNQNYPNVEHIVIDGASTDETPSILERYRDKLAL